MCEKFPVNSFATLGALYNGTTFLDAAAIYESSTLLVADGITISWSSGTYGGQASTCVTAKQNGKSAVWCVSTSTGVVTHWAAGANSFTLKSYSGSPPSSDFSTPSGYTITSV
jgi:hypothetical protein